MFIFVKGKEDVSKTTGQAYQMLTLVQYVEVGGKVKVKVKEVFPERKVNLNDFDFGDIVECTYEAPEFYGDFPKLISVELMYQSPYVELLKTYEKKPTTKADAPNGAK